MTAPPVRFAFDPTGSNANNLIANENHTLDPNQQIRAIAPVYGPFFINGLVVTDTSTSTNLTNTQYNCVDLQQDATMLTGIGVYSIILITDTTVSNNISITYQVVGGDYQNSAQSVIDAYETLLADERPIAWANVLNKPAQYPPSLHEHLFGDIYGFQSVIGALERVRNAILLSNVPTLQSVVDWVWNNLGSVAQNAAELQGYTWAAPPVIGSTTPNTGIFSMIGINEIPTTNTTSRVWSNGDISLTTGARFIASNLYYTTQYTYIANGTGAVIRMSDVNQPLQLYVANNNTSGNGAAATAILALYADTSGNISIPNILNVDGALNVTGNTIISGTLTVSNEAYISTNHTAMPSSIDNGEFLAVTNTTIINGTSFSPTDNRVLSAGMDVNGDVYIRTGNSNTLELLAGAVNISTANITTANINSVPTATLGSQPVNLTQSLTVQNISTNMAVTVNNALRTIIFTDSAASSITLTINPGIVIGQELIIYAPGNGYSVNIAASTGVFYYSDGTSSTSYNLSGSYSNNIKYRWGGTNWLGILPFSTSATGLHFQEYDSSGTFTTPNYITSSTTFAITMIGGGGGSGGTWQNGASGYSGVVYGGAGGNGANGKLIVSGLLPNTAYSFTVGSGGGGGSGSGAGQAGTGGTGGNTSIIINGTTYYAGGGQGGTGGNYYQSIPITGSPGANGTLGPSQTYYVTTQLYLHGGYGGGGMYDGSGSQGIIIFEW